MAYVNPVNQSYCLQMLCESNFERLQQLLPPLDQPFSQTTVDRHGQVGMAVRELARTPYTLTLQLNPTNDVGETVDPEFRVQVYLDARSVEVLDAGDPLNQKRSIPDECPYERMQQKWALNYFLEKWLNFLTSAAPQGQVHHKPLLSET